MYHRGRQYPEQVANNIHRQEVNALYLRQEVYVVRRCSLEEPGQIAQKVKRHTTV